MYRTEHKLQNLLYESSVDEKCRHNGLEVSLKYFEPGHNLKAADVLHAKLERNLTYENYCIYDFYDLQETFCGNMHRYNCYEHQ